MKHIIVSRVNMPRVLDPSNHKRPSPWKDEEWNEKRVELLDKFTRPSLQKQTCQDFEFVTLWGHHFYKAGLTNMLPNERMFFVRRGWDELDEKAFDFEAWRAGEKLGKTEMDFAYQVRHLMREHYGHEDVVLFTNCDSDDCLRYDFVEKIQDHARQWIDRAPLIIDVQKRNCLHVESGGIGEKVRRTPSPFTSSLEKDIQCYPLRWHHSMMFDYLPDNVGFERIEGLLALQTISDTNILSGGTGDHAEFDPSDYF